jgi:hypothetical protein
MGVLLRLLWREMVKSPIELPDLNQQITPFCGLELMSKSQINFLFGHLLHMPLVFDSQPSDITNVYTTMKKIYWLEHSIQAFDQHLYGV